MSDRVHGPVVMDADSVLRILEHFDKAGIAVWIDGGWGIDALMWRQTRPHGDLDLVVGSAECRSAQAALEPLGFNHDEAIEPGLPARLVLRTAHGLQVDIHQVSSTIKATVGSSSDVAAGASTRRTG